MGKHKYNEGFTQFFKNENTTGLDLGNVELKTLKPFITHGKTYYRFCYHKKDKKAEFIVFYHLKYQYYLIINQKEFIKLNKANNSSVLDTELERMKHKFFENGNEMFNYIKSYINDKYKIKS